MPMAVIAAVFLMKALASVISLGSGFRGGLFFATLFMGALGGRLFAAGFDAIWPGFGLDPNVYAVIGMSALSASVVGGPLTMSFIALESTGNLWLTTAVLVAVIISTLITRELFGYSFATWRFHLRGETIRSAADVGWIRDLTVSKLMRPDVITVNANMPIEEFREKFPLGSKNQVVAVDGEGRYVGLALIAEAHAPDLETEKGLIDILHHRDVVLHPVMNIQEAIAVFDAAEAEIAGGGRSRRRTPSNRDPHRSPRHAALCGRIRTAPTRGGRRGVMRSVFSIPSLRAESNPSLSRKKMDCFVASRRAMTVLQDYETLSSFCRQRITLTSGGIGVSGKLVFQSVTPTSPT